MSLIYFETALGKGVRVSGSERNKLMRLASNISIGILLPPFSEQDRVQFILDKCFTSDHYINGDMESPFSSDSIEKVRVALRVTNFSKVNIESIHLNTLLTLGSDSMKLLCHIDARCEINGWFSPYHAKWVSSCVNQALGSGIIQEGNGWEDLISMCDQIEVDDGPIVMSHSASDRFTFGQDEIEADMRIGPDNISNQRFGDGSDAFSLLS